ncbi:MAG TPA: hypothetical protein VGW74_09285 [Propionibacteriaceae bacterium]|nr:hypothetical protein [Propionibacteriaceae bacterium]
MPPRERTPEELAEDISDLRGDMGRELGQVRDQVSRLVDRLDTAPFVRSDLHAEQIDRLRGDVGSLRSLTMWTLGLMCSSIVGAIIVLVITAGRGG